MAKKPLKKKTASTPPAAAPKRRVYEEEELVTRKKPKTKASAIDDDEEEEVEEEEEEEVEEDEVEEEEEEAEEEEVEEEEEEAEEEAEGEDETEEEEEEEPGDEEEEEDDEEGIEVDLSFKDFKDEEDVRFAGVKAGSYHVEVTEVKKDRTKGDPEQGKDPLDFIQFRMEVLAGTEPSQAGRACVERLYLSPDNMRRAACFALALGLASPKDFGKKTVPINWKKAEGKQAVVKVNVQTYNGQQQSRLDMFGIWDVRDSHVEDVPKDAAALKRIGVVLKKPKKDDGERPVRRKESI